VVTLGRQQTQPRRVDGDVECSRVLGCGGDQAKVAGPHGVEVAATEQGDRSRRAKVDKRRIKSRRSEVHGSMVRMRSRICGYDLPSGRRRVSSEGVSVNRASGLAPEGNDAATPGARASSQTSAPGYR